MDWKIWVPLLTSVVTGLLSYFAARSKSKTDIKNSMIQADSEIDKIKEGADAEIKKVKETFEVEREKLKIQYDHDLELLKIKTDEEIRLKMAEQEIEVKSKTDDMTNKLANSLFNNPGDFDFEKMLDQMEKLDQMGKKVNKMNFLKNK